MRRGVLATIGSVLAALAVTVAASPAAAEALPSAEAGAWSADAAYPVPFHISAGATAMLTDPGSAPPGANDWSCRASAAHPDPVILLHGMLANMTANWQTMSPLLANEGYCVFALTYGVDATGLLGGMRPLEESTAEVGDFVDRVLAATGAAKVDLVGHSEGGVVAANYVKHGGGAAQVSDVVTLGSPLQGTDLLMLGTVRQQLGLAGLGFLVDAVVDPLCAPCQEFLVGSDFIATLTEGGVAVPGVHYTTIVTRYDQAVMPAENGLLPAAPNVTPILLQDSCLLDFSDHVNLAADPNVAAHILHALDPDGTAAPGCQLFLPYL